MVKQVLVRQTDDITGEKAEHFTLLHSPWGDIYQEVFRPNKAITLHHNAQAFLQYYGADKLMKADVRYNQGYFHSTLGRIAAYCWTPEKPKATVLVFHGLFDHTVQLLPLIRTLLADGYAVVGYDMPGHGLSNGERGYIADFDHYVAVFESFLEQFAGQLPHPLHIVAQSTGAVPVLQYYLSGGEDRFGQVILTAPLIRCTWWPIVLLLCRLFRGVIDEIPRIYSSHKALVKKLKADPFQYHRISVAWLDALRNWQRRIQYLPVNQKDLWIFQGTSDGVIDWRYSLRFIQEKFPRSIVDYVEHAGHRLYEDSAENVDYLLNNILAVLDANVHEKK